MGGKTQSYVAIGLKLAQYLSLKINLQRCCKLLSLPSMLSKINWDALGITASIACAIHCAVLPLLLTSLPVFGINIIDNLVFEYGMILLALGVGGWSLYHGYRRHHHQRLPLIIFGLGMALLFAKELFHDWKLWFLIPAVVAITIAHFINFRYCRAANHCHASDCNH